MRLTDPWLHAASPANVPGTKQLPTRLIGEADLSLATVSRSTAEKMASLGSFHGVRHRYRESLQG
jgi:hypothetical protein